MSDVQSTRLATLVALAERSPGLGRTALMKLCYFLQVLRDVPLRYRFTLYSYGPFDSGVLSDLASAEALGGVSSEVELYPSGYGYKITPSAKSESLKASSTEFLARYESDLDWVIAKFGKLGSADLELLSTIVYVDREFDAAGKHISAQDLVQRVREVKPRFSDLDIRSRTTNLAALGVLKSAEAA